ncbi:Serine-type D-Ala-D-Ala carboxypeptidase [Syntrophobotulus glycolicus DSM 8271]|uniref:serine-type D-Ala-D-Ala carboxypeptidase n=1 Tax=Syntrophobotulus glycolicus (strain DSM 8271 / FlGlyR) TaxID=645991 RepID=F0T076_SYNGF|nr:Serine-type D-Ala-D-Ala carboxypeptidase [Syntrophobotulus glycolicus DSM 8271]
MHTLKKMISVLISLVIAVSCFFMYDVEPLMAANIETSAGSAILIDASSGKVLYEKDAHKRLAPASVTKLMTLLIAAEALESGKVNLKDTVTASERACSMGGSQIYLEVGEKLSLEEMLISIAVGSANDACVAVAEHINGSLEEFVHQMNEKAKKLGLVDTNFINDNGLPAEGHYTSAYDLAIIAKESLKYPLISKLTSIKEYDLRGGKFKLYNTNKLLWWYEGTSGLKTGWTQEAKYCLASTVERNGLKLICVVMAVPEVRGHFAESMKLYNYGFANYSYKKFAEAGSKQGETTVQKGTAEKVDLIVDKAVGISIEKGKDKDYRMEISYDQTIHAPVVKGQKLGQMSIYNGDELQIEVDLVAKDDVAKSSLFGLMKKSLQNTYDFGKAS